MWKVIIGPLAALLAAGSIAQAASVPRARAASAPAWKRNLAAARFNQVPTRQAAARSSATPSTSSVRAAATTTTTSTLATSLARLEALRAAHTRAFDLKFPGVSQILQEDLRLRAATGQGLQTLNGLLTDTPMNRYLQWRRSLDPSRFDAYHPLLGPVLAEDQNIRNRTNPTPQPGEVTPPPVTPTNPGTPGGDNGGNYPPPPPDNGGGGNNPPPPVPIPEPGSILLVLIGGTGLGLTFRSRARRALLAAAKD